MREVLVIGAGAVGAACASALARAGHAVRVIADPARSTTALSGGHLLLQSKQPGPQIALARRSLELLRSFVTGREGPLRYRRTGSLILSRTPEDTTGLRAHFEALAAAGVDAEWLDGEAARAMEPALSPSVQAATYCPTDAQVDPRALAEAWLADARSHGAEVREETVETLLRTSSRVCGVTAGGQTYLSEFTVLAAGPWSGALASAAGLDLPLRPRRGVLLRGRSAIVMTSRPLLGGEYLRSKFGADRSSIAFSLQQHVDGELVLGGARELVGWSDAGLEEAAAAIDDCASGYLPALQDVDWSPQPAAFRPWMADGRPRVGASGVRGLLLACGFEGDGITLAAGAAELVTRALQGGDGC